LQRGDKLDERGFEMESGFIATWVTIVVVLSIIASSYIRAIFGAGEFWVWDASQSGQSPYPSPLVSILVILLVLVAAASWLARPSTSEEKRYVLSIHPERDGNEIASSPLSTRFDAWALVFLSALILTSIPLILEWRIGEMSWHHRTLVLGQSGKIIVIYSIFIAVWLIAASYLNLWGSIAQIEYWQMGKKEMVLIGLTSLAIGTNAFWLLTTGIWSDHRPINLLDIASLTGLVVLAGIIVAVGVTMVVTKSTPDTGQSPRYMSLHDPASTIGQDFLLHGFMLALAVLSVFVAFWVTESALGFWGTLALGLFPLVMGFSDQVFFTKEAYEVHIYSERHIDIARDRTSILARAGNNLECATWLNEERCGHIAWRAMWIDRMATWMSLIVVIRYAKLVANTIYKWLIPGSTEVPPTFPLDHIAKIEESFAVRIPYKVCEKLKLEQGQELAFIVGVDRITLHVVDRPNS